MKYVAGLDGLRAVAVTAVVLFHAEVPFTDGGFLGVSLFFTLSGFLITSLLLAEHESSGTISLRGFYGRRVRRLLPAAYVCLAAVAACSTFWSAAQLRPLRGDLVAAIGNVANWRFAFATTSYQEIFTTAPSPVAHFWSLAIEEQIYLLLPLVALLALRRGRRALLAVTSGLLLASVLATVVTTDRDLVYNGTHTRIAEVLVGALLAQVIAGGSFRRPSELGRASWIPGAGALVGFGWLVVAGSLDQGWLYRGGLPAVALLSATIIWAVMDGRFPARFLALAPLVAVGRVSYGVYLFHWPVFLLLDEERVGVGGVTLFAVRMSLVTVASYRLVEQPVRRRRVLAGTGIVPAAGLTAAAVAVVAVVVVPIPALNANEELLARGEEGAIEFGSGTQSVGGPANEAAAEVAAPGGTDTPAAAATTPRHIVVIGSDPEVARALASSVGDGAISFTDATRAGCPLSAPSTETCRSVADVVAPLTAQRPDLFVFATGAAEMLDVDARRERFSGENLFEFSAQEYRAEIEMLAAIDSARAGGARVIWYSSAEAGSLYGESFQRIAVMRPGLTVARGSLDQLVGAVEEALTDGKNVDVDGRSTRLLVIGDSTSLPLAAALADGSDGRLTVLWAGDHGCPIGEVIGLRWADDRGWLPTTCPPYARKLPPFLDDFDPDAMLVVSGPTELQNQRYPDGSQGSAGDANYDVHSDAGFAGILDAAGGDMPILVADVPALLPSPSVGGEMRSPVRLDAVNAQIDEWAAENRQVAVFAYRATLEAAEAQHGSLREDGLHADVARLTGLAREVYVDQLLDQIAGLHAILEP